MRVLLGIALIVVVGFAVYAAYMAWQRLNKKVRYLEQILRLVEDSKDIMYYCETKPKLKYTYLSPAIEKVLGTNLVEKSMRDPYTAFERVHPDDYDTLVKKANGDLDYNQPIVVRWKNDEGKYLWFEEHATPIYENGKVVAVQGIIRNIDDKIRLQQQLEYRVFHDGLTGVYSREFFESKMHHYDKYDDVAVAIVICDLDELKIINDTYGHKVGDELIKETAALLNQFSSDDLTVARIGGDEFAILFLNTDPTAIDDLLEQLQEKVNLFNDRTDSPFEIKMSKGSAYHGSSIANMERLLIEADRRMYEEKSHKGISRMQVRVQ